MIWRNFRRELVYTMSRLVSVIIITAVAVMVHVDLLGIANSSDQIVWGYYETQNVADYWITGIGITREDWRKLQSIEGVTGIQPRNMLEVEDRHNEDVSLLLIVIADHYDINTPLILEGRFPENPREMMIHSVFAEENGLAIGDTYEMKVAGSGDIIRKEICALIKSPERMYHANRETVLPDFSRYGYAYLGEDALEGIFEKNIYSQICITTVSGIDEDALRAEISEILGDRLVNVLALRDNTNAYNMLDLIDGLRTIITVFPFFFFLVAVLIIFSTMSRLVENARTSIGTLKALGYSDGVILLYYLLYAVIVVVLGFIIGVAPMGSIIHKPIMATLIGVNDLPPYSITPDYSSWALSFAITCFFCVGTAFVVTLRALQEKPVECMRPKPPAKVKTLFIERIAFLWKRFSFSQKYITRNIMRNKMRMAICIIGVSGCMMLILGAFGIHDSINYYLKMMDENEHRYDYRINFARGVEQGQYRRIANMDAVTDVQYEMVANVNLFTGENMESTIITITGNSFYLKLIGTYATIPYYFPNYGVILEKGIAEEFGLEAGDRITAKFPGNNKFHDMEIAQLSQYVTGVHATQDFWRSTGEPFVPTSAYVTTSDADELLRQLGNYDFVSSYMEKADVTSAPFEQIASLVMVVFILIIFGAVLALVVLYNLGVMSFYEQIRNLATLMVLGFYDKETRKLLLTENIAFTGVGVAIGIPLGAIFAGLVLASTGTALNFRLSITPFSYFISSMITISFAIIVNTVLGKRMKSIDMLGALKSVE